MPRRATVRDYIQRGPLIVISGPPGAGKSTYARRLAREFNLEYFSTGHIFRGLAEELGVDLVTLNLMAERDPSIDFKVDMKTLEIASRGGVVIDSHLAAWLLKDKADLLVYVKAPLWVRAKRVAERDGTGLSEALISIAKREASHWRRFQRLYSIDTRNLNIFHIIVDTQVYDVDEAYNIIASAVSRLMGR